MTPEGKVKQKITALLKRFGAWYFMPRGTALGRSGIPDYICLFHGVFIAIEAKAGKNTPTALQKRELTAIREAGGMALVINENNLVALEFALQFIENNHRRKV